MSGRTIHEVPLVSEVKGGMKIPISDGGNLPQTASVEQINKFISDQIRIYVNDLLKRYVEKIDGKGLSTNDFTNTLKSKLDSLSNYDDTQIVSNIAKLQNVLDTLVSGDISSKIESFNEIISFLENVEDSESFEGIVSGITNSIKGIEVKLTELGQEVSVFSVMNISNEDTKRKMMAFFKNIRIYDSEIKDLSVWNVIRREKYIIQIATMTEGAGYYVHYQSEEKENYIRIDKGNGKAIEMVVDWDVLEPNSAISDNYRKNTLSHKCFLLTPSLNDADKELKIEELNKKNYTSIAKTKFAFNVEDISELAWGFYSDIIQKVRVKADKKFVNEKTRFSLTYLRIESQEEKGEYDGTFSFSVIEDGVLKRTKSIDLYDYGYTKGYTGLLELTNVKPWSEDNILFNVIIDCSKIKLDNTYYLGNEQNSHIAGKVYILPELYDEIIDEDSFFYESITNKGKDFPITWDEDVVPILYMNDCVLDASVYAKQKYRINIAYIKRTDTNTGSFDNTVGFNVFDENGNKINTGTIYVRNDEKLTKGRTGIVDCFYHLEEVKAFVKIRWYLDFMPNFAQLGQDSSQPYYNKMPFSDFVYNVIPELDAKHDSFYYNVLTNSGFEFPIHLDADVSREDSVIKTLTSFVLYAQILTQNETNDYVYEIAYVNRKTESNTGTWDNTIQLGRRKRNDLLGSLELVSIKNLEDLMNGKQFWLSYQWDNAVIRLYLDASVLPFKPLIISNSSGKYQGKQYFDDSCYISLPTFELDNKIDMQVAKVVGDKLYVGAKFDDSNDIIIEFSKCMFNNLMTFYTVGLATNDKAYPNENPDRGFEVVLNRATSDNIGPISISGSGWCGANHSYKEEHNVKTAENISFDFYADGKKLNSGNLVYTDKVEVRVKNRIYNPTIAPQDGDTILSSELCIEDVVYKVEKGNIFVSLSHTYSNENPVTVANYYGMQSMCAFENAAMTPNGAYTDFASERASFNKGDYPNFQRVIERNAGKTLYQSTYLLPVLDGNHNKLDDSSKIYSSSSGKQYHVVLNNYSVKNGDVIAWSGLYSWFKANRDDDSVLVYTADMNGKTLLFIDAKTAIQQQYIEVPVQLVGSSFEVVEKSESITIGDYINAKGLLLKSESSGSLVLSFPSK